MIVSRFLTVGVLVAAIALAGGCTTMSASERETETESALANLVRAQALRPNGPLPSGVAFDQAPESEIKTSIIRGDGNFINRRAATKPEQLEQRDGEVTLNFELADIRDVIKVVFDTLGENYILDPRVQGEVTVQTSRPLPRDLLLPTLETLLQANAATLVRTDGVYKILPIVEAVRGNISPRLNTARLRPGYSVRIFPLKYVSATEMQTILQPFSPDGGILLADPVRNLMILAGTSQELRALEETIDIFDVNWLRGMSVGMYVLENIESQAMAEELDKLFGPSSQLPLAGLFRFVPIDRLNAVMVITPQAEFLNDVSTWIARLDGSGGERLYIYEVQFSDAEYLADILGQVYEGSITTSAASSSSSGASVAPGRAPSELSSSSGSGIGSGSSSFGGDVNFAQPEIASADDYIDVLQASEVPPTPDRADDRRAPAPGEGAPGDRGGPSSIVSTPGGSAGRAEGAGSAKVGEEIRVVADTEHNALLIWASSQNYSKVLNALRKIDVPKRQVLIEATIAEVTLTGELRYGLRWFFQNSFNSSNSGNSGNQGFGSFGALPGDLQINDAGNFPAGILQDGFTYALTNGDGFIRAVLNLLAEDNKAKVLSSPQLMVVDNQEASIVVGDQIPIQTSFSTSDSGNEVGNFQYRDTGVILEVQPQINAGGLVSLNISQEVTSSDRTETIGVNQVQPVFSQRKVTSIVTVQSGQTLVLGGLIEDNETDNKDGIPGLYKIPILGSLFGNTSKTNSRRELVILITPTVVSNSNETAEVTAEIKERMRGVVPLESPWKKRTPSSTQPTPLLDRLKGVEPQPAEVVEPTTPAPAREPIIIEENESG